VVRHAANDECFHLMLASDAAQEGPESLAQGWVDERSSFLGAKDTMVVGADVGHRILSAVPSELG